MNIIDKLTARPSVYLCGPIVGRSYEDATSWRLEAREWLNASGISAYDPTRHEHYAVDNEGKILGTGATYKGSAITHRGFVTRDRFDVERSDMVLAYLMFVDKVSIGSVIEIAWANLLRKPVVAVIDRGPNPHKHEFLLELIDFTATDLTSALDLVEAILLP